MKERSHCKWIQDGLGTTLGCVAVTHTQCTKPLLVFAFHMHCIRTQHRLANILILSNSQFSRLLFEGICNGQTELIDSNCLCQGQLKNSRMPVYSSLKTFGLNLQPKDWKPQGTIVTSIVMFQSIYNMEACSHLRVKKIS